VEADAGTSSGLGLAIVKRILDLHGSAVRVRSEFKRGTHFEFLLPQAA
jgi:signal transduction histidine kinase